MALPTRHNKPGANRPQCPPGGRRGDAKAECRLARGTTEEATVQDEAAFLRVMVRAYHRGRWNRKVTRLLGDRGE
jgi:hypothetical protein